MIDDAFLDPNGELDYKLLEKELDRTKTNVFRNNNAAFLARVMCTLEFIWDTSIDTASTNGEWIRWNPHFFLGCSPGLRTTVLLHEVWHVALMHMIRLNKRDPRIWNIAADIVINNMLDHEGQTFDNFPAILDHNFDGMSTEEVYDALIQQYPSMQMPPQLTQGNWGSDEGDLSYPDPDDPGAGKKVANTVITNVVSAHNAAQVSKTAGNLPGELSETLNKFLSPKLPWQQLLMRFFQELGGEDYSWRKPNRRYLSQDLYLPGLTDANEGLEHLIYFIDVSGSITEKEIVRFNSEFKYVKDIFQPEKMTLVQFDTAIQKVDVFEKEDTFDKVEIIGRGGTSLIPVRKFIVDKKPTAAIIFSDLYCDPMDPLPSADRIPIIWVAVNNSAAKVPHGQLIHIQE